MALVFPLEPAEEEATAIRPALIMPRPGRQSHRIGWAIVMVTIITGSLILALTHQTNRAGTPSGPESRKSTEATVRNRAAAWIATHVSRIDKISCDQTMCKSLEAHRIPSASLHVLRPGAADLPSSGVIVVTAAVGRMVGSQRIATYAPEAIATFGSGQELISIRVIYPAGSTADSSALSKGHRSR